MYWIFSSITADIIFAFALIFVVLYFYFSYKYKHWSKQGIHYIEPKLFFGNLDTVILQKESLMDALKRAYRETVGHKVFGIFLFSKPFLVIRDLDVIRSILAKDAYAFPSKFFTLPEKLDPLFARSLISLKGKKWRHVRIKVTPAFTARKIKMMSQLLEEISDQLITHINQEVSEGRSVMVKDVSCRFTTDAIASCIFGVNTNALRDTNNEFITNIYKMLKPNVLQIFVTFLLIMIPWLQYLTGAKHIGNTLNDFVRKTFWDIVDSRKKKRIVREDFIDLMRQLREDGEVRAEDAKNLVENKQDIKYLNQESSITGDSDIKLEDDDIVAQAYVLVAGGFETTSNALTVTLYELAMNPVIQDRLRREIVDVLEKHDDKITYDAIAEMSYLDMVIAETLRKNPPLFFFERECASDFKIEGTDITIAKGTLIFIPTIGIHYDPDIYPEPEKFDPERFSAENKRNRPPFSNLTFGEGQRKCIGMRFALLQVKTSIVHILKTFHVRSCKDTPAPPLKNNLFGFTQSFKNDIVLDFKKLK